MKKFEAPTLRVVEIDNTDILTSSTDTLGVYPGSTNSALIRGIEDFDIEF